MTSPRTRPASVTVMDSQVDPDTSAAMRWYSSAEPVTVHTLDARLARIEVLLEHLVAQEERP